jgi:hypothetical protein
MICRHTEILLLPWYVGILTFCSLPWYAGILTFCHDMLAYWHFAMIWWHTDILLFAMICRHTKTLLLPRYAGILKLFSCHDMLAYWNFAHAMICQHTEILLLPWYAGILKILLLPWYVGILKLYSCHDMPAYWNTYDSRYHLITWCTNKLKYLRPETLRYAGQDIKICWLGHKICRPGYKI